MVQKYLEVVHTLNYLYRVMTEGMKRGLIDFAGQEAQTCVPFEFILYELNLIKTKLSNQENIIRGVEDCLDDFATIDRLLQTYRNSLVSTLVEDQVDQERYYRDLAQSVVGSLNLARYNDAQAKQALNELLDNLPDIELKGAFFLHVGRLLLGEINSRITFREKTSNTHLIIKSLHFAPWSIQTGLSILGYVPTLLDQVCPEFTGRTIIEKRGLQVFLIIDTSDRHHGIIERTIEKYGRFLSRKIEAGELLPNPLYALALVHKFKLIELEFRYTNSLLFSSSRSLEEQREIDPDEEFDEVNSFILEELEAGTNLRDVLAILTPAENLDVRPAMELLQERIGGGLGQEDEQDVKRALMTIKKYSPETIKQLFSLMVNGGLSKTAGHLFAKWLYMVHRAQVRRAA